MGNYLPSTQRERDAMLQTLGLQNSMDLYRSVPKSLLLEELDLPSGLCEQQVHDKLETLANQNRTYRKIFRGAGAYNHYIPSIVKQVTSKEAFITAYTPYQAEISQGVLQSIFEYQTFICRLTGMEVSNASMYDGATAAAEALAMCVTRKKKRFLVAESLHPMWKDVLRTYFHEEGTLQWIPTSEGTIQESVLESLLTPDIAGVLVPQLNFYGQIEDCARLAACAHAQGALFVQIVNPIAAALLPSAGECQADIACGEGQPLGLPLSFGGPYLGFLAAKSTLTRQLPGRIVGQTEDAQGRRAFVLTLQAREQHIRREKAGSNICTNQALCALRASVYLATMGTSGLQQVAQLCYNKAHYFAEELQKIPGFSLVFSGSFFHECLVRSTRSAREIEQILADRGILSGLVLDSQTAGRYTHFYSDDLPEKEGENLMLWCITEQNTKEQIDEVLSILREVSL